MRTITNTTLYSPLPKEALAALIEAEHPGEAIDFEETIYWETEFTGSVTIEDWQCANGTIGSSLNIDVMSPTCGRPIEEAIAVVEHVIPPEAFI